ncbi:MULTISPECIES: hypothetical protein [unclassified Thermosynechococcus]|uniref:hypothetical protein n=1 Tax=unclassified Thermosynechococcus TaxID=2622553 RepID=UPI001981E85A|nr:MULTISPECIES: hypothetical protein [unclassified Thermosynechococcus]MDR5637800.1 hypothetical protein [Thermosynechococcus sp. PP42]MDR7920592.1 hypothetical protein [Thermosynechococcus sp. HY213]MDR7991950.1 hypothetical protein [Thermosynechococcus sp. TG252]QSF49231.1 hypothetical protein JW907_00070 [Thermosynechococcus sp. TA-1]WKT81244.1 hypothetical protein QYC27_00070 [Thermosynechococcus sp. PP45]
MLRPLIALTVGLSATLVAMPQPSSAQACAYAKGLSHQSLSNSSFFDSSKLPIALGLGAGAITAAAVGVTLWQRRQQTDAPTPASDAASLELPVVLPESEGAERSEDVTPIA